jgi:Flp pilus assembly protein TadG
MKTQSGSVTVEMVLLAPVLMLLILFGVYASRASESLVQVRHAADQAARSASKVSRGRVQSVANDVANRTLNNSGTSCVDFSCSVSGSKYSGKAITNNHYKPIIEQITLIPYLQ